MSRNAIHSYIKLIEDTDEHIVSDIKQKVIQLGTEAIPQLKKYKNSDGSNLEVHNKINQIISDINFKNCYSKLQNWKKSSKKNLLEGLIIIAEYQNPEINKNLILKEFEKLKTSIWIEINDDMTSFEITKIFNYIFFHSNKFKLSEKTQPLNETLLNKKADYLTLSIIYSLVAQKLNLPIFGVDLPNNFILAYMDKLKVKQFIRENNHRHESGVLFYINIANNGSIISRKEITKYLINNKIKIKRNYFEPCSNSKILIRILENIDTIFENHDQIITTENTKNLINLLY